jgi:hypothetical protein
VLAQPVPASEVCPQFRVADFARIGFRIASALSLEDTFTSAITNVHRSQKTFSLDEDQLLVTALHNMIRRQKETTFMTASALWTSLELCAPDALGFTRMYHNAVQLGKKLWALHSSLKEVMSIEWKASSDGTRLWKIGSKE